MNPQTSINKNKLPKVYSLMTSNKAVQKAIDWNNTEAVQDHGCGKYVEHISIKMHYCLKNWYGWDKHHSNVRDWLKIGNSDLWISDRPIDRKVNDLKTVHISSNVMNVITDDWELFNYCTTIYDNMKSGEHLLITVYEAPAPSESQRAEPLEIYVEKLESYYGLETVKQTKSYAVLKKW